ncbi:hypothetical protein PGTUg99_025403 [Puccinia graminis f. sp. tritici]|uniref:Uncharacterized protein n=1 Tax=Puccinia graminis f. sp. tritici TaxID=56615 RepID=A0A5B0PHB1_PUCGR|nr:hypothetical protein PGTUg99_025403 [Puccinia graminis f. sp. tritici]
MGGGGITSLTPQPRRLRSNGSAGSVDGWSQARSNHAPSPTICKPSPHDGRQKLCSVLCLQMAGPGVGLPPLGRPSSYPGLEPSTNWTCARQTPSGLSRHKSGITKKCLCQGQ